MSTRHLLNTTMGAVAILLLAAVGVVFTSLGAKGTDNAQIDLAVRQQMLVQNLTREVGDLSAAENLVDVNQARNRMAHTIVAFDQTLSALLHGGTVENESGDRVTVKQVKNARARTALENGAELWIETGMPLADLAAGEFSVFSAAGQQAVSTLQSNNVELMETMAEAANSFREDGSTSRGLAATARWAALGLGGLLILLGLIRVRVTRSPGVAKQSTQSTSRSANTIELADTHEVDEVTGELTDSDLPVQAPARSQHQAQAFEYPMDFDNVNATVDQMSVDMNTIAGSTDKMRHAIDSVGHALQGMLYSLNEMAADTAEGYKIVRGANNAASYTSETAGELAASAREMSKVVTRVTQLALRTKQVAGQIDAEAVHTGQTGEAFTSVVATEVKGLATQTSQATSEIEGTVAEILGTARQYEEAIGQIIKNISAINKVSQNLGELMLAPPSTVVAGTPLPAAQPQAMPLAPAPAVVPEAAPEMTVPEPAPVETAPTPAPAAAAPEPVAPDPVPEAAPKPPAATAAEDEKEEIIGADVTAEDTSSAIADTAADESDDKPAGSNANVFMLSKPKGEKKKSVLNIPAPESASPAAKTEAPAATAQPAAEPEPASTAPTADDTSEDSDGGGNIFMLKKPQKPAAPAETAAEKEADPEPAATPEAVVESEPAPEPEAEVPAEEDSDSGTNIFMLNKPKKTSASAPASEPAPTAEPEAEPVAEEPGVTVPADEGEKQDDGGNIFMLNKPK